MAGGLCFARQRDRPAAAGVPPIAGLFCIGVRTQNGLDGTVHQRGCGSRVVDPAVWCTMAVGRTRKWILKMPAVSLKAGLPPMGACMIADAGWVDNALSRCGRRMDAGRYLGYLSLGPDG